MFIKKILPAIMALALAGGFAACGSDDPEPEPDPVPSPTPTPTPTPGIDGDKEMTPAESKAYLEESGQAFLGKFRTSDHAELINLTTFFGDRYGDLEAPKEFYVEPEQGRSLTPSKFMKAVSALLRSGNAAALSRAAETYVYTLNFEDYVGIYEPGVDSWYRSDDSNDIVFRFYGENSTPCTLTFSASRDNNKIEYTYVDWDGYWDYELNDYVETEYHEVYKVAVPKTAKVVLTKGTADMVNVTVKTDINKDSHKFSANVDGTVANISIKSDVNGTDSKITESTSLSVSGEKLISSSSTINGRNLCNFDMLQESADEEFEDNVLSDYLTSGTSKVDVMGNVQLYADIQFNDQLMNVDSYFDSYDYYSKSEAENAAKRAADILNRYVVTNVRYAGGKADQATLKASTYFEDWGGYYNDWEYGIEYLLYFPSDKTSYSFDEYFDRGFSNLINQWENLVDSYEHLWDRH